MKNANIKCKEELAERLTAGEVFYYVNHKIWYDFKKALLGKSPFRFDDNSLVGYWGYFADFEVKQNWYDTASEENPVLCICWDRDDDAKRPRVITEYSPKNKIGSIFRLTILMDKIMQSQFLLIAH